MSGAVDVLERIVPHLPESVDRVERGLRVASQRVSRVYVPALLVQIIRANAVVGRDVDLRELQLFLDHSVGSSFPTPQGPHR